MAYPKHAPDAATNYIAEAKRVDGGFLAMWAYPGIPPRPALDQDRNPVVFQDERAARIRAALELHRQLNERTWITGKPERYKHLTGPELALKLREAGVTPTEFARLYGTAQARVMDWIDGVREVPHPVYVLLEIFIAAPDAIEIANTLTDQMTTSRTPREVA